MILRKWKKSFGETGLVMVTIWIKQELLHLPSCNTSKEIVVSAGKEFLLTRILRTPVLRIFFSKPDIG